MSKTGNDDSSAVEGNADGAAPRASLTEEASLTPMDSSLSGTPAPAPGGSSHFAGLSKLCQRNGCSNWIQVNPRWKSKIRDDIQACMDCKKAEKKLRDHARTKKAKLEAGVESLVALQSGQTHLDGPARPLPAPDG